MDDATRVPIEAPIFGLDDDPRTCFTEKTSSPSRDPPTEAEVPSPRRRRRRRTESLAVPASVARALDEFRPMVESIAQRMGVPKGDAPEVAQNLLVELLPKWAGQRGALPAKPREYIAAAARVHTRRYLRGVARRAEDLHPNVEMQEMFEQIAVDGSESITAEEALVMADVLAERAAEVSPQVLRDATTEDRWAAFIAHVALELPASEVAVLLGIPLGTVYNRIRLARVDFCAAILRFRAAKKNRQIRPSK